MPMPKARTISRNSQSPSPLCQLNAHAAVLALMALSNIPCADVPPTYLLANLAYLASSPASPSPLLPERALALLPLPATDIELSAYEESSGNTSLPCVRRTDGCRGMKRHVGHTHTDTPVPVPFIPIQPSLQFMLCPSSIALPRLSGAARHLVSWL
ncbi:hypothetical protein GGS23DRAFT_206560 [Durotheca rogersii]|uniref:uncharacterized protein n=1 Tax=Durotheca rogersii TaxID=419775 RepID=UPI00221FE002|nr:uncharacterized protein GGS23DRAFT_206560 [Durotheca rogersii]KAI5861048.1 hypothetical protein GGS23DRAFT_206560 [Durotheca rogersii]